MDNMKLYLISHTHWDREWYQTFQEYRFRLVRMMDDLIENLECTPEYKCFHLDGQTIVLEDYLQVRPENRERLRKLILAGRIIIGPWYVMPDEFLISGEALIKNLQMGHRICKEYGVEPLKNGYVTDIFGHNSQFPQILNEFDIHSACLYRGIGDYEKDAFLWKSLDGSTVSVARLDYERAYSNFYFAVRWPYEETDFEEEDAIKRMKMLLEHAKESAASDSIVMMDGVDHCCMEPRIPKMVELFENNIPGIEFIHTNIEEYFKQLDTENLETIEGALYHLGKRGLCNQVLRNVLSSMVHIKQANDRCETKLIAYTEPLNAFTQIYADKFEKFGRNDYSLAPRRTYIDEAWRYLISNHPHDSICGCSISDVHRDNEYRYRQAGQIADISTRDCLNVITRNIQTERKHQNTMLIYNPSQKEIAGITIVKFIVDNKPTRNYRFYDWEDRPLDVQIISEKAVQYCNTQLNKLITFDNKLELEVAVSLKIPAFGYVVVSCDNLENKLPLEKRCYKHEEYYSPKRLYGSMMKNYNQVDNGKLVVTVNSAGLLDILDKKTGKQYHDMLLFEDCCDIGDGWNYVKPSYDQRIYSANRLLKYSVDSDGPFACVLSLTYELQLPEKADLSTRTRGDMLKGQVVTTKVTIVKDSEEIRFRTTLDNTIENHRLRVCFPTYMQTEHFYTKTPFDMAKWEIAGEDTSEFEETETFVHPSQGVTFITDKDSTVSLYAKGLYEVEIADNASRMLSLTLMRAFENETGTFEKEDIKMQRELTFEYALSFARQSLTDAIVNGEAYRASTITQHFAANDKARALPASYSFVHIDAKNKIVSSIMEDVHAGDSWISSENEKAVFIRFADVSAMDETVTLSFDKNIKKAFEVNLKGDMKQELVAEKNQVSVLCKANKITTIVIRV